MSEMMKFLIGVSPILLIMVGTIAWASYEVAKKHRR